MYFLYSLGGVIFNKQGVIYFIKQALPPNISAGSVIINLYTKYLYIRNIFVVQNNCIIKQ